MAKYGIFGSFHKPHKGFIGYGSGLYFSNSAGKWKIRVDDHGIGHMGMIPVDGGILVAGIKFFEPLRSFGHRHIAIIHTDQLNGDDQ